MFRLSFPENIHVIVTVIAKVILCSRNSNKMVQGDGSFFKNLALERSLGDSVQPMAKMKAANKNGFLFTKPLLLIFRLVFQKNKCWNTFEKHKILWKNAGKNMKLTKSIMFGYKSTV